MSFNRKLRKRKFQKFRRRPIVGYRPNRFRKKAEPKEVELEDLNRVIGSNMANTDGGGTNDNAYVVLINGVAQGVGENERVGRKISPTRVVFAYSLSTTQDTTNRGQTTNIALIHDRQPSATLPSPDEVYTQLGLRNKDTTTRFRCVYHKRHVLVHSETSRSSLRKTGKRGLRKFFKQDQTMIGATAGLGDISSGALYLMVWNEEAMATLADRPTLDWNSRFYYIDT